MHTHLTQDRLLSYVRLTLLLLYPLHLHGAIGCFTYEPVVLCIAGRDDEAQPCPEFKQVYAFEPIPDIYSVLVRNLHTSVSSAETGAGPRPVALRVALGAEQGEGEFHFFGSSPGESTR